MTAKGEGIKDKRGRRDANIASHIKSKEKLMKGSREKLMKERRECGKKILVVLLSNTYNLIVGSTLIKVH